MNNIVILEGRVGNDAECEDPKRPVSFSLATWENFRDEEEESGWRTVTTWHDIIVWGNANTKEYYLNRIKKGLMVHVQGKIIKNTWEDENGNKRVSQRVQAHTVKFYPVSKGEREETSKPKKKAPIEDTSYTPQADDDLPF